MKLAAAIFCLLLSTTIISVCSAGVPSNGKRSYYYIRCRLNGLVLSVEGNNPNQGTRVVTWPGHEVTQLWYDDYGTGTIRSRLNDFCLNWDGRVITLRPCSTGNTNQQWMRQAPYIRNRATSNKVLAIANSNRAPLAHLVSLDRSDNPSQYFDVQFVDASHPAPQPLPPKPASRSVFRIVSDMNGKLLNVYGGFSAPGTGVIAYQKSGTNNELWYFDQMGIIRSYLNGFALTAYSPEDHVVMEPFDNLPSQRWRLVGNRIMKNQHECLGIFGSQKHDGARVISTGYRASPNQHWHLEYV